MRKKHMYGVSIGTYKPFKLLGLVNIIAIIFGLLLSTILVPDRNPIDAASSEFVNGATTYDWESINIGAGGFVTGLDFADDGQLVVKTDVYGGYRWNSTTSIMEQLLTTESMPAADVSEEVDGGFYEIAIAPSDSSRIYFYWNEYVYISSDSGDTFTRTTINYSVGNRANNNQRTHNNKMAVDPINPDVLYVGTPYDGFVVSYDAGVTSSVIASLPVGNDEIGYSGLSFDRNSGATGGRTNRAFVSSPNNGVYVTNDSGASWSLIAGSPLESRDLEVQSNGDLYVIDTTNNRVMEYTGGSWSNINVNYPNSSGFGAVSLALDPTNDDRLFVIEGGGSLTLTENGGSSWSSASANQIANDIPWLAFVDETYFTSAEIAFNPANTDELWVAQGIGVWKADVSSPPVGTIDWESQSAGIEELVGTDILSIPGSNRIVMSSMDRPIFSTTDISVYPSTVAPDDQFSNGWDLAYSPTDNNFVVGLVSDYFPGRGPLNVSYSNDFGDTWTSFPSQPGPSGGATPLDFGIGGNIAASGTDNVVVVPSRNSFQSYEAFNPPYYTTDGGVTWAPSSGLPVDANLHNQWYLERQILTADPVVENTFYIYFYEFGVGEEIYRSTDGGANWSAMGGRPGFFFGQYNAKLRAVPGNSGHMFATQGPLQGTPSAPLRRTTDGGATWSTVAGIDEVVDIGFGVIAPGESYPSMYAVGYVSGIYGIYRSFDNAVTWTQVGDFPRNWFDRVHTITGDANNSECAYVSFSGSGWAQGCQRASVANSSPVITSNGGGATAAINVQENQTAVTTVTATDADGGDTVTYSISGGADQGAFTMTSDALTFSSSPDFESPTDLGDTAGNNTYVVEVTASDDGSPIATDTQIITITVTNDTGDDVTPDNTPPVITNSGLMTYALTVGDTYNEATLVTDNITASDDTDGTITGSIVQSGDTVPVNGSNQTTTAGVYALRFNVSDAAGNDATEVQVQITVNAPGNNAPTGVNLSATSIQETLDSNEIVGFLSSVDVDSNDSHSYSLVGGVGSTDNADFSIDTANLRMTIAPDFESPQDSDGDNVYDIRIQTNDGNGGVFEQAFQVTITNNSADDAIPDSDGVSDAVEGSAPNGGDYNGDGILDAQQSHVAAIPNNVKTGTNANNPNHYVGIVLTNGRTINSFTVAEAPSVDGDYSYPLGMFSFIVSAASPGATETITLLLDREYSEAERNSWVWRKYDGTTYDSLPPSASLNYGTTSVGSFDVTTVSYQITDGGVLDTDGIANGTITDPIGPAVLAVSDDVDGGDDPSLVDTGVSVIIYIVVGISIMTAAASTQRAVSNYKFKQ